MGKTMLILWFLLVKHILQKLYIVQISLDEKLWPEFWSVFTKEIKGLNTSMPYSYNYGVDEYQSCVRVHT